MQIYKNTYLNDGIYAFTLTIYIDTFAGYFRLVRLRGDLAQCSPNAIMVREVPDRSRSRKVNKPKITKEMSSHSKESA